jgi:hypothetical protein
MVRLFLSVDMVGSTEFKARFHGRGSENWLATFEKFFTGFPLHLAGQIAHEFLSDAATPEVDVWKVMGDEVIFVAEPSSAEEITGLLCALLRTMRAYEAEHFSDAPLRLKGVAWIADFGSNNIELEIPELASSSSHRHIDFIGPDMDLGFRLSKFARPQSLIVSLDVIELLLQAANRDAVELFVAGAEELKGVLFGRPYPIVWLRLAGEPFDFFSWEIERCPMMQAVMGAEPSSPDELERSITDMRRYLQKMHGVHRGPVVLPG